MARFIPGLELNRMYYREAVAPILAAHFSQLKYSAALIGYGSDVLGYDSERSTDHEWGPRLLLFLRDEDHDALASQLADALARHLPPTFHGYSPASPRPTRMACAGWYPARRAASITTFILTRFPASFAGCSTSSLDNRSTPPTGY